MSNKQTGHADSINTDQLDALFEQKYGYEDERKEKIKERDKQQVHVAKLDPRTQDYNKNLDVANAKIDELSADIDFLEDKIDKINSVLEPDTPGENDSSVTTIDDFRCRLNELYDSECQYNPANRSEPVKKQITRLNQKINLASGEHRPGDLRVVVDDVNQNVVVSTRDGKQTKYTRGGIFGKGTVTWDLLVAFAKCNGSLEGNTIADVKKMNTSANRNNLGKKLMTAMGLDKSPIIEGRNGVMRFSSIQLAGGTSSPDPLDRKTTDDQTTEFLRRHGDDMPVD